MAQKISLWIVFAALLISAAVGLSASFYSPKIAQDKTREAMTTLGLSTDLLPKPEKNWARVSYHEVNLDKDTISTIKKLTSDYNPFATLTSGQIGTLTFDQLSLIGEWNTEKTTGLDFTGWKIPFSPSVISDLPIQHLRFLNSRLSVLTRDFGGLSLSFDLEGAKRNHEFQFQSHIKSNQKYISLTASADGTIAKDYYDIDIEIDQGKFEMPEAGLHVTRANGTFSLARDKAGTTSLTGEINAGGLTILDLPWHNATSNIEWKDGITKITTEAKSTGTDDIELALELQKTQNAAPAISGSIHAADGSALANYLTQQKQFTLSKETLTELKKSKNVTIDFAYENKILKYRLDETAPFQVLKLQ